MLLPFWRRQQRRAMDLPIKERTSNLYFERRPRFCIAGNGILRNYLQPFARFLPPLSIGVPLGELGTQPIDLLRQTIYFCVECQCVVRAVKRMDIGVPLGEFICGAE